MAIKDTPPLATGRVLGNISGFDELTTLTDRGQIPTSDHYHTKNDLFLLLKEIRDIFKPEYLEELEEIIQRHVQDLNNPHHTTLIKMGTSVLQELYLLWLKSGHTGEREDFIKQLFQYVEIADIDTTLQGESLNKVTSVRGVKEFLNKHNTDPDAHEVLWETMFPGSYVDATPSMALHGYIGLPDFFNVQRDSTLDVMDRTGKIVTLPKDKLTEDYSVGDPAFPIFPAKTNNFLYSENFSNAKWVKSNCTIVNSTTIPHLRNDNAFAQVISENGTPTTVKEHLVSYNLDVKTNMVYNISIFVHPNGRDSFGIRIPSAIAGRYPFVHFNLNTQQVFMNDTTDKSIITGGMTKCLGGWTRCFITFRSGSSSTCKIDFYPLDIYDGDVNYKGEAGKGVAIFGATAVEGSSLPPYIYSNNTMGKIASTNVSTPIDKWYNPNAGTFVFDVANVSSISVIGQNKELYTIADSNIAISLNGRFPANHSGRFYFNEYNATNTPLTNAWSTKSTREWVTLIHGYDATSALFGYNEDPQYTEKQVTALPNPNCTTLYLGCDRFFGNHFDGYIRRVLYYPKRITPENINFFLEE